MPLNSELRSTQFTCPTIFKISLELQFLKAQPTKDKGKIEIGTILILVAWIFRHSPLGENRIR